MNIYQPYTYLIGWSHHNKWYYGVRHGKNCHPSDLWKTYFTSSKIVKEFRKKHGEPDIIKIRKTFTNSFSAGKWEALVLRRIKAAQNSKWLNRCNSNKEFSSGNAKWYTNGQKNILIKNQDIIPTNYIPGRTVKLSETSRIKRKMVCGETKWYTNGQIDVRVHQIDNVPVGFLPGRRKMNLTEVGHESHVSRARELSKNSIWYTNGTKNVRIKDLTKIPDGFFQGFTNFNKSRLRWYTDGGKNIRIKENADVPTNFRIGRSKWK